MVALTHIKANNAIAMPEKHQGKRKALVHNQASTKSVDLAIARKTKDVDEQPSEHRKCRSCEEAAYPSLHVVQVLLVILEAKNEIYVHFYSLRDKKHVLVCMEPKYKKLRLKVYKLDAPFKSVPSLVLSVGFFFDPRTPTCLRASKNPWMSNKKNKNNSLTHRQGVYRER